MGRLKVAASKSLNRDEGSKRHSALSSLELISRRFVNVFDTTYVPFVKTIPPFSTWQCRYLNRKEELSETLTQKAFIALDIDGNEIMFAMKSFAFSF